jgi:diketogulonate reductase-like aldo/keto reductase
VRRIAIPGSQARLPVIGQGTWRMGESRRERAREVEALRLGISLGMTLIDTAEMYGWGGAESVVGEAIRDCRDQVFVVTKVWPSHAGRRDAVASVRASLRRLGTDCVDAVLLHWPTRSVPLSETLRAFAELRAAGAVRHLGVSNMDGDWLAEAEAALPAGERLALHQVPYSLAERAAERDALPHARANGQVVMAYSPLGKGRLTSWPAYPALREVAARRGVSPAQAALAWVVSRGGVVAIPKAVDPEHVRENAAAGSLELTPDEARALEAALGPAPG